jgi:hypothetical protein
MLRWAVVLLGILLGVVASLELMQTSPGQNSPSANQAFAQYNPCPNGRCR